MPRFQMKPQTIEAERLKEPRTVKLPDGECEVPAGNWLLYQDNEPYAAMTQDDFLATFDALDTAGVLMISGAEAPGQVPGLPTVGTGSTGLTHEQRARPPLSAEEHFRQNNPGFQSAGRGAPAPVAPPMPPGLTRITPAGQGDPAKGPLPPVQGGGAILDQNVIRPPEGSTPLADEAPREVHAAETGVVKEEVK